MITTTVPRSHARPGPLLQFAALAQAGSALVLARLWSTCDGRTALLLLGTVLISALAGAWALWLRDAFESRVVVALTASAVALGVLLAMTVGMPGGDGGSVTPAYVVLLVLSGLVLASIGVDTWRRTRTPDA